MTHRTIAAVVALFGFAACNNEGPQLGQMSVRLTDAPNPGIASAMVWVSRVSLVGGGAPVDISTTPTQYDLLSLQGGVTAALGSALIPVGDYEQLRLVVDSARITLAGSATFSDGSNTRTLKVPSGMQSGIKVNFSGPVHVAPGQTVLVVDFDASRSFVFTGSGASPNGALFKPVLHATAQDVAGSVSGVVTPDSAHAHVFAISGAADTVASTSADSTGAYSLRFLAPGSYTIAAAATGFKSATQPVTVGAAQNVTGVNFALTH
jgi:hypothetical protein